MLKNADREESLAALHSHTGWKFMQRLMLDKKKSLEAQYRTVDPNNAAEIAKIQGKLQIIEELKDKPEQYFKKRQNKNGG